MYSIHPSAPPEKLDAMVTAMRRGHQFIPEILHSVVGFNHSGIGLHVVWEHAYESPTAYQRYMVHPFHANILDRYLLNDSPERIVTNNPFDCGLLGYSCEQPSFVLPPGSARRLVLLRLIDGRAADFRRAVETVRPKDATLTISVLAENTMATRWLDGVTQILPQTTYTHIWEQGYPSIEEARSVGNDWWNEARNAVERFIELWYPIDADLREIPHASRKWRSCARSGDETTMRALVMNGFGSVRDASMGRLPAPQCRREDILVQVAAAGVNPTDWKEIEGNLTGFYPPYEPNWAPGFDAAGIVVRTGEAVSGFNVGDSVTLLSDRREGQSGTYAELVRANYRLAAHAPESISLTQAGSIPVAGLTAFQGLFRADMGRVKPGETLLIHGGSGGIGSFATSFASANGVHVAVTCRGANAAYMKNMGAELTIDYTTTDIAAAVKQWIPSGVHVVLDATSGGANADLLEALAPGGRLIVVATVTDDSDLAALASQAQKQDKSVHLLFIDIPTVAADLTSITRLIDSGAKMPEITCYPLERSQEALEAMRAGGTRGKRVVEIAYLDRERSVMDLRGSVSD